MTKIEKARDILKRNYKCPVCGKIGVYRHYTDGTECVLHPLDHPTIPGPWTEWIACYPPKNDNKQQAQQASRKGVTMLENILDDFLTQVAVNEAWIIALCGGVMC